MKRNVWKWLLGFSIIIGLLIFMIYPRYYIRQEISNVITFNNDKELFVFVRVSHYGYSGNYLNAYWKMLTEIMPSDSIKGLREDTVILHYKGETTPEKIELRDFSTRGVVYFEGNIYSADPQTKMYRQWTGKNFEALPEAEAQEIMNRKRKLFQYDSDQNKSEGWSENTLADSFEGNSKIYQFEILKNIFNLQIKKIGRGENNTISVLYQVNKIEEELVNITSFWKRVTKNEYFAEMGELTKKDF